VPSPLYAYTLEVFYLRGGTLNNIVSGLHLKTPPKARKSSILYNLVIDGIQDITSAYPGTFSTDHAAVSSPESNMTECINCIGNNLPALKKVSSIDLTRTYSTSITDTFIHLGIQATRRMMYMHLTTTFNGKIPTDHLTLLINSMTTLGYPVPITGGDMLRGRSSMFRISLPNTYKHVNEALMCDPGTLNVSNTERLMFGRRIRSGTGAVDVITPAYKSITEL
jgi:hypothetical protein